MLMASLSALPVTSISFGFTALIARNAQITLDHSCACTVCSTLQLWESFDVVYIFSSPTKQRPCNALARTCSDRRNSNVTTSLFVGRLD
jgi:hypothetical protein